MWQIVRFTLFLSYISLAFAQDDAQESDFGVRIIGGQNAIPGQFPFLAFIRIQSSQRGFLGACGGTLVAPDYILTAAHCCYCGDNTVTFEVAVNLYNTDPANYSGVPDQCTEVQTTDDEDCHPGYVPRHPENDFCLLRLPKPSVYPPATIYDSSAVKLKPRPDSVGKLLLVIGFGKTGFSFGNISDTLQKAMVPVSNTTKCRENYQSGGYDFDPTLVMCTNTTSGNDTCQGDSGGPLFTQYTSNNKKRFLLVGVTSTGPSNCADPFLNGLYGRVDTPSFKNWAYTRLYPTTRVPTSRPTRFPTPLPSCRPTRAPTTKPTRRPTLNPTSRPSRTPTGKPNTRSPTTRPTRHPTHAPTSKNPTQFPSRRPSRAPTSRPTRFPTQFPTTRQPTFQRSCISSVFP